MKIPSYLRMIAAVTAVAATPFAVTALLNDPPDISHFMNAAITFTAQNSYITEPIDLGGGNLILYKPSPQETEEAVTEPPPETAEETTSPTETTEDPPPVTEPSYIITQNISPDEEDLTVFDSQDGAVEIMTFSQNSGANYLTLSSGAQIRNCTDLDNDFAAEQAELLPDIKLDLSSNEPQVLIMHTHACESYLVDGSGYYDSDYTSRTTDASQSVVAVGQRIAEKLAENGICVIHDGTLHDYPYYNGA